MTVGVAKWRTIAIFCIGGGLKIQTQFGDSVVVELLGVCESFVLNLSALRSRRH